MKCSKENLEMLGIEAKKLYIQSMRSTTELHPDVVTSFAAYVVLKNTINPAVGTLQDRNESRALKFS